MKIGRFILMVIGVSIFIQIAIVILERALNTPFPASGMAFLPVIVAAMFEGQKFGKANNRVPEKPELRRFAWQGTLAVMGLSIMIGAATFIALGGFPEPIDGSTIGIILAFVVVIAAIHYWGIGLLAKSGARGVIKQMERKAQK